MTEEIAQYYLRVQRRSDDLEKRLAEASHGIGAGVIALLRSQSDVVDLCRLIQYMDGCLSASVGPDHLDYMDLDSDLKETYEKAMGTEHYGSI